MESLGYRNGFWYLYFPWFFFLALQTEASLKDRYHLHNLNNFRRLVYAYIASS